MSVFGKWCTYHIDSQRLWKRVFPRTTSKKVVSLAKPFSKNGNAPWGFMLRSKTKNNILWSFIINEIQW